MGNKCVRDPHNNDMCLVIRLSVSESVHGALGRGRSRGADEGQYGTGAPVIHPHSQGMLLLYSPTVVSFRDPTNDFVCLLFI